MQETLSASTEDVLSKRRGRKTVNLNYFAEKEELAVRNFLIAETFEEKNKIYNEFLLRLTYNSVSIMTIPKLGYKHTNMREGSIFWNYKFGESIMTEDEVKFWIQTAKREYFFVEDRAIKYELSNE